MKKTVTVGIVLAGLLASALSATEPLSLRGEKLGEGLPALGKPSGVNVRCGRNAADRRLILFSREKSYPEVILALKSFVPITPGKALYFREGDHYVFDEDRASRKTRDRAAERRRRESRKRRVQAFQEMEEWLQDPSAQPNTRWMISGELAVFKSLPLPAREAILSGRPTAVPWAEIGPVGQQIVAERFSSVQSYNDLHPEKGFYGAKDLPKVVVHYTPTGSPDQPGLSVNYLLSSAGGSMVEEFLHPPKQGKGDLDWQHYTQDYRNRRRGPEHPEEHPELLKSVGPVRGIHVEESLEALSMSSELPLIGEYDPCLSLLGGRGGISPFVQQREWGGSQGQMPLHKVLDSLCKEVDLDWDFQGGWIQIRSPRTLLSWAGELDLSPVRPEERPHPNKEVQQ